MARAATWSKFMDSLRSKRILYRALSRYALDKLDGAELGGRRIRIFEEGKSGGGGGRGRSRSRSR